MRFTKRQSLPQINAAAAQAAIDRDVFLLLAEYNEKKVVVDNKTGFKFQSNVKAIGSFFLDLDCGPEAHKFPDKKTALTAFAEWVDQVHLPPPSAIVDSGGGIHIYWSTGRSITPAAWLPYAQRLIAACKAFRFKADPVVTIDHSRFLRMPGSNNHKHTPPRPCRVIGGTGQYVSLEAFCSALDALNLPTPSALSQPRNGANSDLTSYASTPALADPVIDKCEQMLWHWNTQGSEASEPEWFAALCLLAHLEGGYELRHEISVLHRGYTAESTEAKWSHAAASKGPPTCARFQSLRPELCANCRWAGQITSPIQLGRDVVPACPAATQQIILGAPEAQAMSVGRYIVLPEKAIAVMTKAGSDAEPTPRIFFHGAMTLKHVINQEGGKYRYIFGLERPGEKETDVSLDGGALYSPAAFATWLGSNHISVGLKDAPLMQDFTTHYIKRLQAHMPSTVSYDGFGWRGESHNQFIVGTNLLSAGSDDIREIKVNDRVSGVAAHIKPAGDLNEWKKIARLFTASDMPAHAFGFAAGFGAPLMEFLPEKGTVLSLVSPTGSQGKTSVLRMQNSIYGDPDGSMMQPSDTVNARFHMTGILRNLPVTMDEITNVEPRELSDFLLNFTLGREKMRMKPDGSEIQSRRMTNHWATILTCTSNSSLTEKLMLHRGNPHAENLRLFEASLILPEHHGSLDARNLLLTLRQNHGIAGLIYIRYLLDNLKDVKAMLLEESKRVVEEFEIPNYDRFATPLCAAVFVGAQLANKLKLTDFDIPAMRKWAKEVYTGRVGEIDNVANSAPHEMLLEIVNELQHDQTQSVRGGKTLTSNVKTPQMVVNFDKNTVGIALRPLRKMLQERHMDYGVIVGWLKQQGWFCGEEMIEFYYGVTGYTTPRKALVFSSAVIGKSRPQLAVNNDLAGPSKIV